MINFNYVFIQLAPVVSVIRVFPCFDIPILVSQEIKVRPVGIPKTNAKTIEADDGAKNDPKKLMSALLFGVISQVFYALIPNV